MKKGIIYCLIMAIVLLVGPKCFAGQYTADTMFMSIAPQMEMARYKESHVTEDFMLEGFSAEIGYNLPAFNKSDHSFGRIKVDASYGTGHSKYRIDVYGYKFTGHYTSTITNFDTMFQVAMTRDSYIGFGFDHRIWNRSIALYRYNFWEASLHKVAYLSDGSVLATTLTYGYSPNHFSDAKSDLFSTHENLGKGYKLQVKIQDTLSNHIFVALTGNYMKFDKSGVTTLSIFGVPVADYNVPSNITEEAILQIGYEM